MAYRPFGSTVESRQVTDTLVTKVLLGTFGCLPACDRFFIAGFRNAGFNYSRVNQNFVVQVLDFCRENLDDLRNARPSVKSTGGVRYPLMKLVDMYFWQIGYELEPERKRRARVP